MPKDKKKAVQSVVSAVKSDPQLMAAVKNVARRVDNLALQAAGTPKGPMQRMGTRVGRSLGAPGFGALVGKGLGKLTGTGPYTVEVNSIVHPGSEAPYSRSSAVSSARFGSNGEVVRVRKREFVGMLHSAPTANAFFSQSFRLNPGNPKLFPWLSSFLGYEQWNPLGVAIELVSVASEYASGGTLGSMGVAIDYQGTDSPYASKLEAENSDGAVSCKVSDCLLFGAECAPHKRPYNLLYVRTDTSTVSSSSSSINSFDLGNIQVFSVGVPSTNIDLAEIWVTYDIEFEKQQLMGGPMGGGTISWGLHQVGYTNTLCLGNNTPTQYGCLYLPIVHSIPTDPIAMSNGYVNDGATSGSPTICFPDWLSGVFHFAIQWSGTGVAWTPPTITLSSNITSKNYSTQSDGSTQGIPGLFIIPVAGETGSFVATTRVLSISPSTSVGGSTLTFGNAATLPTSGTAVNVWLDQIALRPSTNTNGLPQLTAAPF